MPRRRDYHDAFWIDHRVTTMVFFGEWPFPGKYGSLTAKDWALIGKLVRRGALVCNVMSCHDPDKSVSALRFDPAAITR